MYIYSFENKRPKSFKIENLNDLRKYELIKKIFSHIDLEDFERLANDKGLL